MRDVRRLRRHAGLVLLAVVGTGCGAVPSASSPTTPPLVSSVSAASPTPSGPASSADPTSATPSPSAKSSSTPTPKTSGTPAPKTTDTYADDLELADQRLTFTRLRWYWGKAARARCKAKHVKAEFEWCNDYYYEKTRTSGSGTLSTDAKIKILDDDGQPVRASAAELAAALRQDSWPHWRIWLTGTEIVRLEQVFTP